MEGLKLVLSKILQKLKAKQKEQHLMYPIKRIKQSIKKSFVQQYCKLKLADIHDSRKDKWRWEWLIYTSIKVPFTAVEEKKITKNGFNSKFHRKYQTASNFDVVDSKFRFKYLTEESNLDKSFNLITSL